MIGVVFGGASAEHDVSVLTGLQASRALSDAGNEVTPLYLDPDGTWLQVPVAAEAADFVDVRANDWPQLRLDSAEGFVTTGRLRRRALGLEVVLNCCHGGAGEDGSLHAALQLSGHAVTGPPAATQAVFMDKLATNGVAAHLGIPVIPTVPAADAEAVAALPAPWILKPRFGGSSIGIHAGVEDLDTVAALVASSAADGPLIAQPFKQGWTDVNIAVRAHPQVEVSAIEKPLRAGGGAVLDYADKYLQGGAGMHNAPRELPADVPDAVARVMRDGARALAGVLPGGAPRIDFLWDGGDGEDSVVLCEVNAIPGAWGTYLWDAIGVSRVQFLTDLLEEARTVGRPAHWQGTRDGRALRASGSIAAKLA